MRTTFICLTALFLTSCGNNVSLSSTTSQEAFESYVTALNAGDTDKAASYYDTSEGFHWVERGHIQYDSGSEAADALKGFQSNGDRSEMTLDNMRVAELSKDSTLISTHFDFTMYNDTDEALFSFDGWMTVGMVKRGTDWKIAGGQTGPGKSE